MGNNFLSATANFDDFINQSSAEINSHVQKNNEAILKKVFNFFQTDSKLLLINGFAGVGKKQISEHTLSYLDKDTIIMKYICTESSVLDDVLLTFNSILKQKTSYGNNPELDAIESVRDKVEYFLSKSDIKVVPVFYNFDEVKDNNREDILSFIYSLIKRDSSKVVLCSRTFDTDILSPEIKYVKVVVKALSKQIFEDYLKEFGIKVTPAMVDQLYRLTRGYFFSTCICVKYMINQEINLNDFIVQYTNSGENFDLFLAKSYYRLIVGTTKSAFNIFVKLHHGLNLKVLQTVGSYPEVVLKTLSENFYIYKKSKNYYPNEFLKLQLMKIAPDDISRERLISYYNKQLELVPEDRDIIISRAALQAEIAYYEGINLDNVDDNDKADSESEMISQDSESDSENTKSEVAEKQNEYDSFTPDELYDKATTEYGSFSYAKAIDMLTNLLGRKDTVEVELKYKTYELLAKIYSKLTKWSYSLYYYELLEEYYTSVGNTDKVADIRYERAFIYYQSYKIIDAIKLLKDLQMLVQNNLIVVKTSILLGNIALSASNKPLALEYFAKGIKHIEDVDDAALKMELFFKYGILSDESGDTDNAISYYNKCIEINDSKCKYLALSYSNLGDLYYDNGRFAEAKECFEKSYGADKENDNFYGMYYALTKIIELTDKKDKDKLVELALEAKECALKTDDYNALLLSVIKLGDIYYDYPEPEKALAEYLALYREGVEVIEEPNFSLIKSRIEDIRARLGKEKFEELAPNYE